MNRGIYHTKTGQLKEHHQVTMSSRCKVVLLMWRTSRGYSTNFLRCRLIFDDMSAFRCIDFLHFSQFNNVNPNLLSNKQSTGSSIYNLYREWECLPLPMVIKKITHLPKSPRISQMEPWSRPSRIFAASLPQGSPKWCTPSPWTPRRWLWPRPTVASRAWRVRSRRDAMMAMGSAKQWNHGKKTTEEHNNWYCNRFGVNMSQPFKKSFWSWIWFDVRREIGTHKKSCLLSVFYSLLDCCGPRMPGANVWETPAARREVLSPARARTGCRVGLDTMVGPLTPWANCSKWVGLKVGRIALKHLKTIF